MVGVSLMKSWISLYLTDDKSTFVQVMTWCPQAASHFLSKCRPRSMSTYGVTRPHWVNKLLLFSHHCFLSHFTPRYPQLTCISTQPLYSHQHNCFLCHLLIFHNKKHHLNLLSSITKALLTHILASFLRKQSFISFKFWTITYLIMWPSWDLAMWSSLVAYAGRAFLIVVFQLYELWYIFKNNIVVGQL